MEKENDVQLIQRILSGDEAAFGILVDKYQRSVHALVWRKVGALIFLTLPRCRGDYTRHVPSGVQKITDPLRALTKQDPYKFAGWLYVIANRLCIDRIRKKNLAIQSLEDTPVEEIEKSSHAHHVSEQSEIAISEHRREIVKKLLARLPESERTVMTLHYLGEMTVKEISMSLGVSVSAIHNRLYRARKRLQASEPTIEIVDTHIVLDIMSKPDVRNRVGQAVPAGKSSRAAPGDRLCQTSENQAIANASEDSLRLSETQWMPDPALREAVREKLDIPSDTPLTQAYLQEHLTSLDARHKEIADLTGLEHATDLQALVLIENEIHDISPLSCLSGLSFLDLGGNQISDLRPLAALTRLETLQIWRNQIEDISPLAGLVNLKKLLIENNDINDLC